MSDEKKSEAGLSDEELAEVTGGASVQAASAARAAGLKTYTTTTRLQGGASSVFIKSLFGSLPGGGTTVIRQG